MKKKLPLLLFLAFACSCSKPVKFPDLNVDPMIAAYKANHIDHYEKYFEWKGIIISTETVHLNECGLPISISSVSSRMSSEGFEYDSLCRKIEYQHLSDSHFKKQYHYKLIPEANQVLQYEGKGTDIVRIFQYSEDFGRLLSESSKHDVFGKIVYEYSGNKITGITKIYREMPKLSMKTKFVYNEKGKLKIIYQPDNLTEYISEKTGLVDSVVTTNNRDKVYYKYYKRE